MTSLLGWKAAPEGETKGSEFQTRPSIFIPALLLICIYVCVYYICAHAQSLSCVLPFVTPWTVTHQAPLLMECSSQEYWSGLPFPISITYIYSIINKHTYITLWSFDLTALTCKNEKLTCSFNLYRSIIDLQCCVYVLYISSFVSFF